MRELLRLQLISERVVGTKGNGNDFSSLKSFITQSIRLSCGDSPDYFTKFVQILLVITPTMDVKRHLSPTSVYVSELESCLDPRDLVLGQFPWL